MAPIRSTIPFRRRSSLSLLSTRRKPLPNPKNYTFAQNITPVSYPQDRLPEDGSDPSASDLDADNASTPAIPSTSTSSDLLGGENMSQLGSGAGAQPPIAPSRPRRRRKDSSGAEHIPRPPNAFMLYRQNFVHQRHVPGSIETNTNSLSRIVGDCWKSLPGSERKKWEELAEKKKAEHKRRYPDYRFQPKHDPEKKRKRAEARAAAQAAAAQSQETQSTQQLYDGAGAVGIVQPTPQHAQHGQSIAQKPYHLGHRRSSSVPLPSEAYAYAQAHGVYPYNNQTLTTAGFTLPSYSNGYQQQQHQQLSMIGGPGQQTTATTLMESHDWQHQQYGGIPPQPHSAAPHPGYQPPAHHAHHSHHNSHHTGINGVQSAITPTPLPLAQTLFPGGAHANPFNFANPAIAEMRLTPSINDTHVNGTNGNSANIRSDEAPAPGVGIALPTVPRLTPLATPSSEGDANVANVESAGKVEESSQENANVSSQNGGAPQLHAPIPQAANAHFMPQQGSRFPSFSGMGGMNSVGGTRLPSFSMGIGMGGMLPMQFSYSGDWNAAAAEGGGEFVPPQSFYVPFGTDAVNYGGDYSFSGGVVAEESRSLQHAAAQQRALANLGRRASSTQPILERQRAYVLGQLGGGDVSEGGADGEQMQRFGEGFTFGTPGFAGQDMQYGWGYPFDLSGNGTAGANAGAVGGEGVSGTTFTNPFSNTASASGSKDADGSSNTVSPGDATHVAEGSMLPPSSSENSHTVGPLSTPQIPNSASASINAAALSNSGNNIGSSMGVGGIASALDIAAGAFAPHEMWMPPTQASSSSTSHSATGAGGMVSAKEKKDAERANALRRMHTHAGTMGESGIVGRNSFDFTAVLNSLHHSVPPSHSGNANVNIGMGSGGQQQQQTQNLRGQAQETGASQQLVQQFASPHAHSSYTHQQVRPQEYPPYPPAPDMKNQRVVSAPASGGLGYGYEHVNVNEQHDNEAIVAGQDLLEGAYAPSPMTSGSGSASGEGEGSPAGSAGGSPVGNSEALPGQYNVTGNGMHAYSQQQQNQQRHDEHEQQQQQHYALQSYYAGLGDVRMGSISGPDGESGAQGHANANPLRDEHRMSISVDGAALNGGAYGPGPGMGMGGNRFSFSDFVHDSPSSSPSFTARHVVAN